LEPRRLREQYRDRQRSLKDITAEAGIPVDALAAAARKLGIRNAILTSQVRQLEATVGTPLLRTRPDGNSH